MFRNMTYIRLFSGICKGNRGVCDEKLKNAEDTIAEIVGENKEIIGFNSE